MANSEIQKDSFVKISYHTELETEAVISATAKEQVGLPIASHLLWVIQVSLSEKVSLFRAPEHWVTDKLMRVLLGYVSIISWKWPQPFHNDPHVH